MSLTRDEVSRSSPEVLPSDRHLMSSSELNGFHVQATDGEIGHVDDVLVDEDNWNIRYVVLDTSNWIGGRSVVISSRVLKDVDLPDRIVRVDVTRDDVRRSPAARFDRDRTGRRRAAICDYLTGCLVPGCWVRVPSACTGTFASH